MKIKNIQKLLESTISITYMDTKWQENGWNNNRVNGLYANS